jgi:hypothetical protein
MEKRQPLQQMWLGRKTERAVEREEAGGKREEMTQTLYAHMNKRNLKKTNVVGKSGNPSAKN